METTKEPGSDFSARRAARLDALRSSTAVFLFRTNAIGYAISYALQLDDPTDSRWIGRTRAFCEPSHH